MPTVRNFKGQEKEFHCNNCLYGARDVEMMPCADCKGGSQWTPEGDFEAFDRNNPERHIETT